MNPNKQASNNLFLYFVAFAEGATLLVAEVCSAKLIESQIGVSLYVWSSVLSTTLIGLAIGYFAGGYFTKMYNPKKLLFYYLLIGGAFVTVMPYLSFYSLQLFFNMDLIWISILSTIVFLLPPIILLGCVSPTLIELLTHNKDVGKEAGLILSISTLGGVISVLMSALIFIPAMGLTYTCIIFGSILITTAILLKVSSPKYVRPLVILFVVFIAGTSYSSNNSEKRVERLFNENSLFDSAELISSNILSDKTGVFGSVLVVDFKVKYANVIGTIRGLLVNNTIQSITAGGASMLAYTEFMKGIFNAYPTHRKVLHIGLGGGIVSTFLANQNRQVTAVEIDKHVVDAAQNYFNLPKSVKVALDDGRHFLNRSEEKYDILILNAFNSSIPPWNLFTKQSFEKCYSKVNQDGVMVVEVGGIVEGDEDALLSSVNRTIESAGWNTLIFRTSKATSNSDYIIVGHKEETLNISNWNSIIDGQQQYLHNFQIDKQRLNQSTAKVFTDDNPILLNMASKRWKNK